MKFSIGFLVVLLVLFASPVQGRGRRVHRENPPRFKSYSGYATSRKSASVHAAETSNQPMIIDSSTSNVLAAIIAKARHSVVQIVTTSTSFNWLRPWETSSNEQSAGSGFFIELGGKGFILTNGHVVEQAVGVVITLPKFGKELFQARIHSVCHDKDVALLVLEESSKDKMVNMLKDIGQDVAPLEISDSDKFQQGSVAIAVGYPLGHPNLKASTGILAGNEHVDSRFYLQVTSPINPGNSGGPLLNSDGKVMGINTAAIESASNVGYSLPSNHFIQLLNSFALSTQAAKINSSDTSHLWASNIISVPDVASPSALLDGGSASDSSSAISSSSTTRHASDMSPAVIKRFPVLGVDLTPATESTPEYLGCSVEGGVFVAKVESFGLFKQAGVKEGDLLLEFNGHKLDRYGETQLTSTDERLNIYDLSERFAIGKPIALKVWRGNSEKVLSVPFEFSEKNSNPIHQVFEPLRENIQYEVFGGMVFMPLTLNHLESLVDTNPVLARYLDDDNLGEPRLVVTNVLSESTMIPSGAVAGGDVVSFVNGQRVKSLQDFRAAFKPAAGQKFWTLKTENGGLVVLNFAQALATEAELSGLNGYSPTDAVAQFMETELPAVTAAADMARQAEESVAPTSLLQRTSKITSSTSRTSRTFTGKRGRAKALRDRFASRNL